jgi:hypothetical protein
MTDEERKEVIAELRRMADGLNTAAFWMETAYAGEAASRIERVMGCLPSLRLRVRAFVPYLRAQDERAALTDGAGGGMPARGE